MFPFKGTGLGDFADVEICVWMKVGDNHVQVFSSTLAIMFPLQEKSDASLPKLEHVRFENRKSLYKHFLVYSAVYMTVYDDGERARTSCGIFLRGGSLLQVRPLSSTCSVLAPSERASTLLVDECDT